MRPYEILSEWTVEELMVAYGEYANIHSRETYEMLSDKDRAKRKIKPSDRWAVKFISLEDALKMQEPVSVEESQSTIDLQNAADLLLR